MEKVLSIKAGVALLLSAIAELLGWKGVMLVAWVVCMGLDYISGTMAALRSGDWSSDVARDGLWHKGGMIFVVLVSALADLIIGMICANTSINFDWPVIVLPLVLAWYILTELGSILENAVKMGANVPQWLVKLLKTSADAVEAIGGKATKE